MKKIFVILASVMLLASCQMGRFYNYETTITYRVHYSDTTVTETYTFDSTEFPNYTLNSVNGSNHLYTFNDGKWTRVASTTAPIEVVSFDKRKK